MVGRVFLDATKQHDLRNKARGRGMTSALGSFEQSFEFLRAHAVFRESAPLDTGRTDRTRVQMPALLTGSIRLVAPDLDFLTALLAADIFRFG